MATVDVVDTQNRKAGQVELSPAVFEARVREHLFHAEVRRQLASRHRGTHSTRNRAGVSGGGIKPWKQKGTGRARQGSIRAPQWSGGGVVFGPVPRSYDHSLNKKTRRAALCAALSHKFKDAAVTVADGLTLGEFKTKVVLSWLEKLGLAGHSVLIVVAEVDEKLAYSTRNIPNVLALPVAGLNVYDVLRHEKLLIAKEAVAGIEARLAKITHHGGEARA
jgi:large subunit ribosomal protein L4